MKALTQRSQITLSLVMNFIARIPSVAGLLLVLPLIHRSLGTGSYGMLLASIGLGTLFTLPLNGVSTVGRRILAEAVAADDRMNEADAFASLIFVASGLAFAAGAGASLAAIWLGYDSDLVILSGGTAAFGYTNVLDNARATYHQHFVTAFLQATLQILAFVTLFFLDLEAAGRLWTGVLLVCAYPIASILTGASLVMQRRYLVKSRPTKAGLLMRNGVHVVMSDGLISATLNLGSVWSGSAAGPAAAAWFGTLSRLFQSLLTPLMLVLIPLSSAVTAKWAAISSTARSRMRLLFIGGSFGYGACVALAIGFGGDFYLDRIVGVPAFGGNTLLALVSLLFGSVVAQKCYTLLVYSIEDAQLLSIGTSAVLLLAAASCWTALTLWGFAPAAGIFCGITAGGLLLLIAADTFRKLASLAGQR